MLESALHDSFSSLFLGEEKLNSNSYIASFKFIMKVTEIEKRLSDIAATEICNLNSIKQILSKHRVRKARNEMQEGKNEKRKQLTLHHDSDRDRTKIT